MAVPSLQYSPSLSSLAPSFPSTSEAVPYPASSASSCSSRAPTSRRSLTLFIPKHFSAFIRPQGATSSRRNSLYKTEESQTEELVLTEYADVRLCDAEMDLQHLDIYTPQDSERPSRKPEKSKFYNFLRRSRSRSRPKTPDTAPIPELPNLEHGHAPVDQVDSTAVLGDSKPPTLLQSRPLSSTTTTTNTTITPSTPTQIRRPRKYPPIHDLASIKPIPLSPPLRPSTPKPSNTRKKLHDLFGIPLSNSRKSSVSRPDSPEPSHDVPPLPRTFGLNFTSNTNENHNLTSHLNHDHSRSNSRHQIPSQPSESVQIKGKGRAFGSSKLDFFRTPRFFSGSGPQKSNSTRRFTSSPARIPISEPTTSFEPSPPLHPSISAPAAVSPTPSVMSGSDTKALRQSTENIFMINHEQTDSTPAHVPPFGTAPKVTPSPRHRSATLIPRIIQTPPTPAKSITSPSPISHRRNSMDLKSRPGGQRPLAVVGEENLIRESEKDRGRRLEREARERGRWSQRLPSPKFFGVRDGKQKAREKEGERQLPLGRVVIAITHNPTLELERPTTAEAAGKPPSRRNGSKGVTRSSSLIGNGRTKHGSFDFEKPVWSLGGGKGSSSVARGGYSRSGDSLQSGTSTHSGKHTEKGESFSRRPPENGSAYYRTPTSSSNHLTSPPSTSSHATSHSTTHTRSCSLSTPGPASSGLSSSLSRASGKGAMRITPVGLSHGPFAFEPPVPSPTVIETSEKSGYDPRRTEIPETVRRKMNRKGRSLDLGLGLAWAPTKVREEALMSFGRTVSRESAMRDTLDTKGRSTVESDVTAVFHEVLGEAGFAKFKKYVHRFDAHAIPFDGPSGIVTRVERLLDATPSLDGEGKRDLLDRFVRIILQNA